MILEDTRFYLRCIYFRGKKMGPGMAKCYHCQTVSKEGWREEKLVRYVQWRSEKVYFNLPYQEGGIGIVQCGNDFLRLPRMRGTKYRAKSIYCFVITTQAWYILYSTSVTGWILQETTSIYFFVFTTLAWYIHISKHYLLLCFYHARRRGRYSQYLLKKS